MRKFFFSAYCSDHNISWGKGDTTGYVSTTGYAFSYYDSDCIGKSGISLELI